MQAFQRGSWTNIINNDKGLTAGTYQLTLSLDAVEVLAKDLTWDFPNPGRGEGEYAASEYAASRDGHA